MPKEISDKCDECKGAVTPQLKGTIRKGARWVIPDNEGNVLYSGKNLDYMLKKYHKEHPGEAPCVVSLDPRLEGYLTLNSVAA